MRRTQGAQGPRGRGVGRRRCRRRHRADGREANVHALSGQGFPRRVTPCGLQGNSPRSRRADGAAHRSRRRLGRTRAVPPQPDRGRPGGVYEPGSTREAASGGSKEESGAPGLNVPEVAALRQGASRTKGALREQPPFGVGKPSLSRRWHLRRAEARTQRPAGMRLVKPPGSGSSPEAPSPLPRGGSREREAGLDARTPSSFCLHVAAAREWRVPIGSRCRSAWSEGQGAVPFALFTRARPSGRRGQSPDQKERMGCGTSAAPGSRRARRGQGMIEDGGRQKGARAAA